MCESMQKDTLGPQCLTCRKRQVKCDSIIPGCDRCRKDKLKCPGYKRPFAIIAYSPTRKTKAKSDSCALKQGLGIKPVSTRGFVERPLSTDAEYLDLLEAFEYYDKHVMPRTTPAHWPFQRKQIDRDVPWHVLPTIIKYCMILSLRSMLTGGHVQNPTLVHKDLQYYRGLSLSQMQRILQDADADPHGIALACMVLMMGADVSLCRFGSWVVHFTAAQKLIGLRGGFSRALKDLPQSESLLVKFMVSDVFTGTTCDSFDMGCSHGQFEIANLEDMDEKLIRQGCICPFAIVRAISQTNVLRADTARSKVPPNSIYSSLELFDAAVWAYSQAVLINSRDALLTSCNNALLEAISYLTDAARCFQLAALLYLSHSCLSKQQPLEIYQIHIWRQELTGLLRIFFNLADINHDAAVHTQFWKFLTWPLFISFYVGIGWYTISNEDHKSVQKELNSIEAFASKFQSSALAATTLHLRCILKARFHANSWTWDDGFMSRYSFVL